MDDDKVLDLSQVTSVPVAYLIVLNIIGRIHDNDLQ